MNGFGQGEGEAARERQSYVRHELRAPLAVMFPLISLLLEGRGGDITDEQRQYLEALQRSVERLEARIVSATESGWLDCAAAPMTTEAVSLDEVVEEMLTLRRLRGLARPLIEVTHSSSTPPIAAADRDHLRQILADLIDNAGRHTLPGGSIRVWTGLAEDASTVTLTVRDGGCGMSPDELVKAFDFGYRGGAGNASQPGLGIGLWVCRELVSRNAGSITIESVEGGGTTVTVILPAVGEDV